MNRFCDTPFWDLRLTWYTSEPRFTPCFESTVSWFPLVVLGLFGIIDLFQILNSKITKSFPSTFTKLLVGKTVFNVLLVILQLLSLFRLARELDWAELCIADWVSPPLQLIGYVVVLGLNIFAKQKGIYSSACQFLYWMSAWFAQGILFYSALHYYVREGVSIKDNILGWSRLIAFPIVSIRLILELISYAPEQVSSSAKINCNPSPDKTSSFFSKLLFCWYDSVAWRGYRTTLNENDLWDLNAQDRSRTQSCVFAKHWDQELAKASKKSKAVWGTKRPKPGILIPLWNCFGTTLVFGFLLKIVSDLLVFVQPTIVRALMSHVTTNIEPAWKGWFYVAVITFTSCCQIALSAQSSKRAHLVAMRVKSTLKNAVFRKTLKIPTSSQECSLGSIVNLQAVDAGKLSEFIIVLNASAGIPFKLAIASYLLYVELGFSAIVGISMLFVSIPIALKAASCIKQCQMFQMKMKDLRTTLTSELIAGIKVLKFYAWEDLYRKRIEDVRQKELKYVKKLLILNAFIIGMNHWSPVLVTLATFATFVLSDPVNILNAEKAFVAVNVFNILKFALILLPIVFGQGVLVLVSIQRLNKYLNLEEIDVTAVTQGQNNGGHAIIMKNATLCWNTQQKTLRNLDFAVNNGELVAVVGRIGSGKSSLISSILGELYKMEGTVNVQGTVSYVSQTAWIQNATVKANILFFDELNSDRYQQVVEGCALKQDWDQFPYGDETEIGENGINLSGGQKQRVALARSAYKDASIYIFDDPLSAVDAQVGKHIFEKIIGPSGMLANKTRVLVTNDLSLLPVMDRIFILRNGQIADSGTYSGLLAKKGVFTDFLVEHSKISDENGAIQKLPSTTYSRKRSIVKAQVEAETYRVFINLNSKEEKQLSAIPGSTKLVQRETVAVGNIKLSIFLGYFKAAGYKISLLAVLLLVLASGLTTYSNVWLTQWSSQSTLEQLITGKVMPEETNYYLTGYVIIAVIQGLVNFIANLALALVSLGASKILQSAAISRLIRAPMSYFDTTLAGRLVNRFSLDVDTIDNSVPAALRTCCNCIFQVISTFLVIAYVHPPFILFVVPMTVVYIALQRFYVATSRQLIRLDGITRSPIYSHFGETIAGSSIIRAFGLQQKFIADSEHKVDCNQKAVFPYMFSNMWIAIRLEIVGVLVILSTCIFTLLSRNSMSPGSVGLAITYAFQVTFLLSLMARQMSELETNIVSAERIKELTHVPQEAPWIVQANKLSPTWPEHGEVKVVNYSTRYREGLELVLKGATFEIHAGEKIGVVGRTGAGKSSLTLALFRLIEASEGKIWIDGVDISTIGIHDLRKKLTIIPQDSLTFSGSLRTNLDPLDEHSDEDVWRSLELAHLKPKVRLLEGQLQHELGVGNPLSVGERQLLCLARALLRKTRILVLDEATAAVDLETDGLLQSTIRKEFGHCTVITIAHRLNTIMDSNRWVIIKLLEKLNVQQLCELWVLVLERGEIKEFDRPANLLADINSTFYRMARSAGLIKN